MENKSEGWKSPDYNGINKESYAKIINPCYFIYGIEKIISTCIFGDPESKYTFHHPSHYQYRCEIFDVFVSTDGKTWVQVADDIKNDEGQYFASINLPTNGPFKYVKIVNQSPFTESPTPGADIDAIEALWASSSP